MIDMINNKKMILEKTHLSIGEASKYLSVSIDTLRRWEVRSRIFPYRSPGGHRYYTKEDLDKLFNKKYTRDEFSKTKINKEIPVDEVLKTDHDVVIPETTTEFKETPLPQPVIPLPEKPTLSRDSSGEDYNKQFLPETETQKPQDEAITPSILEPIPAVQNQYPVYTPQPGISLDHQQKLDLILGNKKVSKPDKGEVVLIISVLIIVIADVFLFLNWYSSTNIIAPIP